LLKYACRLAVGGDRLLLARSGYRRQRRPWLVNSCCPQVVIDPSNLVAPEKLTFQSAAAVNAAS
jgi:hypothetical protein